MTTKSCGTCEFWDRDTADESIQYSDKYFSNCLKHEKSLKELTYDFDGQDCEVYKKIKEE